MLVTPDTKPLTRPIPLFTACVSPSPCAMLEKALLIFVPSSEKLMLPNSELRTLNTVFPIPFSIVGTFRSRFPTMGSIFPLIKVLTVSFRDFSDGRISSPSVRFPSKSDQAAFMDAREPEYVSAASAAVVPVIPMFSWIL